MAKKRYDNAVTSFSRVLSLQDDPAASYLLGAAFLQLKENEKAKEVFRKLSDTRRGRAGIHMQLADAYRASNDMENVSREVQLAGPSAKVKPLSSSPMGSVMADAAQLGSSFETIKLTQQERARIDRLKVELRTLLASAFNDLGTAEARQEQYSIALAHFHEAAGWNADITGLRRNTGIAAGRAMDYPECIRALRPVVAKNPHDNVARAMLGTGIVRYTFVRRCRAGIYASGRFGLATPRAGIFVGGIPGTNEQVWRGYCAAEQARATTTLD